MNSDSNKKYKIPKKKTLATTNPESSSSGNISEGPPAERVCPLLAKDSEWVDILQTAAPEPGPARPRGPDGAAEEEVLQLVECDDEPKMKPLAIMFPGILDKDPQTLHGMLNRAMSTTEVTRHLVDLGQKANFEFMKKADRLIPPEKQWLESVTENSNSVGSLTSSAFTTGMISLAPGSSSSYEASDEISLSESIPLKKKKKPSALSKLNPPLVLQDIAKSDDTINQDPCNERGG